MENVFVVGPIAKGASFIGRTKEIEDLKVVFSEYASGIHLYGPTRIGKSSLADAVIRLHKDVPNRIVVKLVMSEYPDAFSFWQGLSRKMEKAISDDGLHDDLFDARFSEINAMTDNCAITFLKEALYDVLYVLGENYCNRLVLIIDEFDSVKRVFGDDTTHYQILRTLYSDPDCFTSGILISRMALKDIESYNPNVSSFSGVFDEVPLKCFSCNDMEAFYSKLSDCNVFVTEEGKDALEYYTGRLPMLCSMMAKNMVLNRESHLNFDAEDIRVLFLEHQAKTEQYYSDLKDRLEEDGLLEVAMYLAFGMRIPTMSRRRINNLMTYGVLITDVRGQEENGYYIFSKDFMDFLKYVPLSLPVWDTITLSEKKIKEIFSKEYGVLSEIRLDEYGRADNYALQGEIEGKYPELHLDWDRIRSYGNSSTSYMRNPSILDVLTLPYIISIIIKQWDNRFYGYFGVGDWRDKLSKISRLRNPIAHGHVEYIAAEELAEGLAFCKEIIRLT